MSLKFEKKPSSKSTQNKIHGMKINIIYSESELKLEQLLREYLKEIMRGKIN